MPRREDLIELETKVGFLEHTVDTLNDVLVEQGRHIERLEEQLSRLEARLQARDESGVEEARDLSDDKPPHY